jgi:hypothetical protein
MNGCIGEGRGGIEWNGGGGEKSEDNIKNRKEERDKGLGEREKGNNRWLERG